MLSLLMIHATVLLEGDSEKCITIIFNLQLDKIGLNQNLLGMKHLSGVFCFVEFGGCG